MLKKQIAKKSWFRFGLKLGVAGIVAEGIAVVGSYFFYRKLNREIGAHINFVNSLFNTNKSF